MPSVSTLIGYLQSMPNMRDIGKKIVRHILLDPGLADFLKEESRDSAYCPFRSRKSSSIPFKP